ncbi:indolepyruvate ferredoxin oxidoreductase family protein [Comamonas piscis]|uniref:Indolepyruvate ferredoxin oxidoreductase family protein n=1 Tax=Comamonas piscis TaxID=1562974 RepID=A0A7G5EDG9_9BURK|nr:indolepyruvate ferredoxin oxidoreductase family protein [Comamonas piscis]QMV72044.1 indolepyruvate ferredoxin oxidoreductase family protein [Comamonas piscis]WSO34789.1 indolepyruvate ferredoxin oxidoreductase family protein [Comamonas piscis]
MNASLPESVRKALETVTLDDKYALAHGRAFMSGVQALVRLPMLQRQRDALEGLNTAGFISGYRGSPLGGYDQALWAAKKHLKENNIEFQPGVNEELGATAVWGTQQLDLYPQSKKFDGVFGIWYGKGPGVDRSVDVFKHANMAGTAKHGGVIALAGDDHISKSSTAAHQSDHIFKAVGSPVFFPSSVQDILDMGLHAFALSRFSGVWSGMKTIQEIVESSASVSVDPDRVNIITPDDFVMPPGGLHIRWPDAPLEQEARLMDYKWYAALAYIRANKLNYNVISTPNDRFGIIASGKAFNDTRQALIDLGLDDDTCRQLGIRLHKVNVVWPLEASITRDFAMGLQEILVVEEKRQMIEYQLKEELYNWRSDVRPHVLGKFDETDGDHSGGEWSVPNPSEHWLLRPKADLTPALIAQALAKRLKKLGVPDDIVRRMDARLQVIAAREQGLKDSAQESVDRLPWFCSGCPHNTSTRVPEGSRAVAGIGCHYMVNWMPDRNTSTFTQMGGEGVTWVGQAPFTTDQHIFSNLGDGTYFHSGLLAIRQSIASGVNITYKVLYNDAVAMTGGQRVGERPEGHSVLQIMTSLISEGVKKLVIVTDEPEKYQGVQLGAGVTVHHRDELDRIQREFRELKGTTAIIYDQTCATEKRRRRKRGTLATPAKTVIINEAVCEGCGDCSVQSNCLSVEPVETDFGRKRKINQSTCNKDFSCVKGFCPSFVTIEGGQLRKAKKEKKGDMAKLPALPDPVLPVATQAWGIVVAGVGGTGVITIGSLLGMAAHLEGKGVVTQDAAGLAQKGGSTWSHIQIANSPSAIYTTKVDTAKADLIIGCDPIVAANKTTLSAMQQGRTFVALNTHGAPTAAFVHNPNWQFPEAGCESAILAAVGQEGVGMFDAEHIATQALGDSIYTNPLILGFAWQKGRVPLSHAALMRAMELNGVQVDNNKAAFEWGRQCAANLPQVQAMFAAQQVIQLVKKPSLPELLAKRVAFLTDYQDSAYAADYQAFVDKVHAAEAKLGSSTRLSQAVARYLFKLMAYKDEYEVARLHTTAEFSEKIAGMFEGDYKIVHHLAPPTTAKRNDKGELVKKAYGGWMRKAFGVMTGLKGLRGGAFDIFGRTEERRTERALIVEYRACIDELLQGLSTERLALAVEIASIPEDIRGYGHVKERHLAAARSKWQQLMARWRAPANTTVGAAPVVAQPEPARV